MTVASFPSLKPAARSWTPNSYPMTPHVSLSGYETRTLHGSKAVGSQLSLSFNNLLEQDVDQITAHFLLAKGTYEAFALPAAVFAGMASTGQINPSGYAWRYAAAPSVTYQTPGVASVSISLLSVLT